MTEPSPLKTIEPRLRLLLPADLYALAWIEPTTATLKRVFQHLRTFQRCLYNYTPRQVLAAIPEPGEVSFAWEEGTLMFTDLAGFTPLMEANASQGQTGAEALHNILNIYFEAIIEILGKSGGNLLEFTGDALLAQFPDDGDRDTARAVRAGLRMQRAMERFANITTERGTFQLKMRVGIHTGRFLTANIGTPFRMAHVLLGGAVHRAKKAEGAGTVGRVCLTETALESVHEQFRWEPGEPGHVLIVDDLTEDELGQYDLAPPRQRLPSALLTDSSFAGLTRTISQTLDYVEPLASYLPRQVLKLLVENAAYRRIPTDFTHLTVVFVNLIGLAESIDDLPDSAVPAVAGIYSSLFARLNAAVEARGGVLKNITYHLKGADIMIYFGAPNAHTNDPIRAAETALAIRGIIQHHAVVTVNEAQLQITCKIGIAYGPGFAAEVGAPRGRHEFNIMGDTVNTAARLMNLADKNQILLTEAAHRQMRQHFACKSLGKQSLKGKANPMEIFALHERKV